MSFKIKAVAETSNPEQFHVTFADDEGHELAVVCVLSHASGIGWGLNWLTKTDLFSRADGPDSRDVLEALIAFRAKRLAR